MPFSINEEELKIAQKGSEKEQFAFLIKNLPTNYHLDSIEHAILAQVFKLDHISKLLFTLPGIKPHYSATQIAVMLNKINLLTLMIENNLDFRQKDLLGETLLEFAANQGKVAAFTILLTSSTSLASNPDYSESLELAFLKAASSGHNEIIKLILTTPELEDTIKLNTVRDASIFAAFKGNTDLIKVLFMDYFLRKLPANTWQSEIIGILNGGETFKGMPQPEIERRGFLAKNRINPAIFLISMLGIYLDEKDFIQDLTTIEHNIPLSSQEKTTIFEGVKTALKMVDNLKEAKLLLSDKEKVEIVYHSISSEKVGQHVTEHAKEIMSAIRHIKQHQYSFSPTASPLQSFFVRLKPSQDDFLTDIKTQIFQSLLPSFTKDEQGMIIGTFLKEPCHSAAEFFGKIISQLKEIDPKKEQFFESTEIAPPKENRKWMNQIITEVASKFQQQKQSNYSREL